MLQTLSSTKEGEDAFMRIGKALDSIDYQHLASNSKGNGSFCHQDQSIYYPSETRHSDTSGPKLLDDSHKVDTQIPSELITSCVAALIMIQVNYTNIEIALK